MMCRGLGGGFVVVAALALVGCDAVPALRFEVGVDDGSVADGPPVTDGGDESQSMDAPDAIEGASPEAGCQGTQAGATNCCGTIWCVGDCDANCGKCATCPPGTFCCDRGGAFMILCRPPGTPCK